MRADVAALGAEGGGVCSLPAALKETKSDFLPDWIAHPSVTKDDKYGNTGVETGQLERERERGKEGLGGRL